MTGYAVVDVETTGLFSAGQDRIAEIAVVLVDPDGKVEDSWATLVNPGRDLGAQHIHGIRAADARHAQVKVKVKVNRDARRSIFGACGSRPGRARQRPPRDAGAPGAGADRLSVSVPAAAHLTATRVGVSQARHSPLIAITTPISASAP